MGEDRRPLESARPGADEEHRRRDRQSMARLASSLAVAVAVGEGLSLPFLRFARSDVLVAVTAGSAAVLTLMVWFVGVIVAYSAYSDYDGRRGRAALALVVLAVGAGGGPRG